MNADLMERRPMDDLQRRAYANPMRDADRPFPPDQVRRHGRATVALTANF